MTPDTKVGPCQYCGQPVGHTRTCRYSVRVGPGAQPAPPQDELPAIELSNCRLAKMIRLWCKVHDIEYTTLAKAWEASPSTVTRFLADEQMPNGPTMARVIAWLMDRA